MAKGKELANVVSEETMLALQESYPVEQGGQRILLPRLGFYSQDQVEGKGKATKVTTEAGTFYIEKPTDEEDENGKKVWEREEIGTELEGIILFQRKQLNMFDEKTEEYISSPVYDKDEEIIPIFKNREEIGRGTPRELQAKYEYTDAATGKIRSKLEVNRILYVQVDKEIYQMRLRGSSMFSFLGYSRKLLVPSVVTQFSSEPRERGQISWNMITFTPKRKLNEKEAQEILAKVVEIKRAVELERAQFTAIDVEVLESRKKAEDDFNRI